MQIVIDIPEQMYLNAKADMLCGGDILVKAIKSGMPLSKGHGRIMDVDKILKKMEEREEKLKDDRSIWETAGVETALDMFGETIIEADKEN